MSRHEYFQELSAAASIGQASGAELAELHPHLATCPDCQHIHGEFARLNASQFAFTAGEGELQGDEAASFIDSALFRERFLRKAEAEGIIVPARGTTASFPRPRTRSLRGTSWSIRPRVALAAAVLLVLSAWGSYRLGRAAGRPLPIAAHRNEPPPGASQGNPAEMASEAEILRLQAEQRRLTFEISFLKSVIASKTSEVAQLQAAGAGSEKERASLAANLDERNAAVADLQQQLVQTQASMASIRADLDKVKQNSLAQLVEDRARIHDLSDQLAETSSALDRERELLSASRDVRDLMAARNLHIVDVFDTDARGKSRPAYGRIFLTEGKSLIFYAYDLNDKQVQNAGYNFRIWGTKEGPHQSARNLGIFYSDDKTQKRWVFKYDDPKVLSEIDSVFVTLEPPNANPSQPKGEKLMYAYLRGQANHP